VQEEVSLAGENSPSRDQKSNAQPRQNAKKVIAETIRSSRK